jgi:hypothetical protein
MAVRLSALRADRPLPPRKILGTHFCHRLSRPQGHSAVGRIRSSEKSSDLIGIRSRDLPACSIVPEPTTLPRAPYFVGLIICCILLCKSLQILFICHHNAASSRWSPRSKTTCFVRRMPIFSYIYSIGCPWKSTHLNIFVGEMNRARRVYTVFTTWNAALYLA